MTGIDHWVQVTVHRGECPISVFIMSRWSYCYILTGSLSLLFSLFLQEKKKENILKKLLEYNAWWLNIGKIYSSLVFGYWYLYCNRDIDLTFRLSAYGVSMHFGDTVDGCPFYQMIQTLSGVVWSSRLVPHDESFKWGWSGDFLRGLAYLPYLKISFARNWSLVKSKWLMDCRSYI